MAAGPVARSALLLLAAVALAGCGAGDPAAETAPAAPPATTAAPGHTGDTGAAAPADEGFSGTSLEGEPIALSDFRGRPLLVNVWSSW